MRVIGILLLLLIININLNSQNRPASLILEDLKGLKVVGSVLYIAAHPDDENTRLISYLSNDLKLRTGYISMTRGDGGQNLIGSELDEFLGVIRTHELLRAREIDGGIQFFTRANDFGYSKNAEETFSIWDKDSVLLDLVHLIRTFKPDVNINRFDHRTSGKTHGHHTASAILGMEAFDLARNSLYRRDLLDLPEPVRVDRIFFNTSYFFFGSKEKFDAADKSNLYLLDIGSYYPASGLSNGEISAQSRSMHKSQGFGINSVRGTQLEYFERLDAKKAPGEASPFDGLNFSWSRFNGGGNLDKVLEELINQFDVSAPYKSIPLLQKAEQYLEDINAGVYKEVKLKKIRELIFECAGIFAKDFIDRQSISNGVEVRLNNEIISRSIGITLDKIEIWPGLGDSTFQKLLISNNPLYWRRDIELTGISQTAPFWLRYGRDKGMYRVDETGLRNLPVTAPTFKVRFKIKIFNKSYDIDRPVIYKNDDPVIGEVRQPADVLPLVTVMPTDQLVLINKDKPVKFNFTIKSNGNNQNGKIRFRIPEGIVVSPSEIDFHLEKPGDEKIFELYIQTHDIRNTIKEISMEVGGEPLYFQQSIRYGHIPWLNVMTPAKIKVTVCELKIKPKRVAYIDGAGDNVDEALVKMGFKLDVVKAKDLWNINKNNYDVIVFGIRAFNTCEELAKSKEFLENFARNGGKVIFQYNTGHELVTQNFLGEDFKISRNRVTNESSPVKILMPMHKILSDPNKINEHDFDDWVQERGLYFPGSYPKEFEEILSMSDSGEPPLNSGLLCKKIGKGYLIYTSLSWFRQLPAGVPGAYRLFANIISF
ncbi:MAG: PIG-L family deacetylase [Saprospiraceae bacterium]|nr:PIG-L family deacetylase [Candidatus Vicinibacter affinis]